jgi:hypothetical protein
VSTGYAGRVRIVDYHGVTRGERRLPGTGDDCAETVNALALAISIGIDDMAPDSAVDSEPVSGPAVIEAPVVAAGVPPARGAEDRSASNTPLRPTAPPVRLAPFAGARLHGVLGAAPSATAGASLAFGMRRAAFSGALEGRADLAASTTTALGSVSSSTYLLALVPCVHFGLPFACVLVGGGAFAYEGGTDLAESKRGTVFVAVSGARVGAELPLAAGLDAFVAVDLIATLTPHRVRIDEVEVYRQSTLSAAGGIGMKLHFR